jgi:hypothetical protein
MLAHNKQRNGTMTSQEMTTAINEARNKFFFYGFTTSPLTRREIAKLIIRGRTQEQIYSIGCDVAGGYSLGLSCGLDHHWPQA